MCPSAICPNVGVEVGGKKSLSGRECSGKFPWRVEALHLATRIFLVGNHVSDEQQVKERES